MKSELALGNKAVKDKNYSQALKHFYAALALQPELSSMINGNIKLVQKKLGDTDVVQMAKAEKTSRPETIDIVVPVYNALDDVKLCLQSLAHHTDGFKVRVLVVNDGSDEATTQWLLEFCACDSLFQLIEHPANKGYTCAVNTGLRASTAEYVITQNSDTIVPAGWLQGMIRCMKSDPKIGVVGPLSNAASWQNVPVLRDESGGFAVNDLPQGQTVDTMAKLVASVSCKQYPRLPFVNGFCFMIRRSVIDSIGYMDEENFPVGYGEENDYCIRVADAGFELAIVDDVYVFHAKSKSFGHERRKTLSEQGTRSLKKKHTVEKYQARVVTVKKTEALDSVRARIQSALEQSILHEGVALMSMRILFLLPVQGGGGGVHSIAQEVTEMRRIGIDARVAVKNEHVEGFLKSYADIARAKDTFVGFDDYRLIDLAQDYDVVVGTIFTSMKLVKRIVEVIPHILPAYYVQDYEPMFFNEGTPKWQEARESYTMVANAFLFAKTQWIIDEVMRHHGVTVHKVEPSIDHDTYYPRPRTANYKIQISAMIRPQTPRRGAHRTMNLLAQAHRTYGERLSIQIFGCATSEPAFSPLIQDFPFVNHGTLTRPQVAALLANSDLFLDLSDYQAFGRTALEAMACGCAVVVPSLGGTNEYAVNGVNAMVVDTKDEKACWSAVQCLLNSPDLMRRMQHSALRTSAQYSVHLAAISECLKINAELVEHRPWTAKQQSPELFLYPSRDKLKQPLASAHVRLLTPYKSPEIRNAYVVRQSDILPTPGQASIAILQRQAPSVTLPDLKAWILKWKQGGGRLVFDIDDDLLNSEALLERGFSGDLEATISKVRLLASSADLVLTSTEPLAKKLRTFNSYVHVIPNAIDDELWSISMPRQHAMGPYAKVADGPVRIGYIGTPTHDADLKLISKAMNVIESKFGASVEIEVIGGFQNSTPTFGKRVGLPRKHEYPNFVRWLRERVHWDIGVIPLVDDSFNRSKSYLKFLECAALDMAMVVSDVPSYAPVTKHGVNCLLAKPTTEDWVEKLTLLIEDAVLRKKLAQQARLECATQHTLKQIAPSICRALKSLNMQGVIR